MSRIILYNQKQARETKHAEGVFFQCDRCRQIKPVGKCLGTGYAYDGSDKMTCYACCGQIDRLRMLTDDRITLFLSGDEKQGWKITNWPGSLVIKPSHVRPMRHPFARKAWIAYFRKDGRNWSAKNIGDSQIAHCRVLKS